jgi:preprotein translocase subunit SecD
MAIMKEKIKGVWVIIGIAVLSGWLWHSVVTKGEGFTLGLDLAGGSALTYQIKTEVLPEDVSKEEAVESLRDVAE